MKKIIGILGSLIAGIFLLKAQTNETLTGPYLGQEPPQMQSRVFAPGFISTDAGELNSVYCSDGKEFYFSRRGIPGRPSTLMVSRRIDDTWSHPEQLEFSGEYSDIDLFVMEDWRSIIFCSNRPNKSEDSMKADHDFWISKREGDSWLEPVPFATEAMSEYEDFYPVVTASGNLYFNSERGGLQGNNIYCSQYLDGRYTQAIKLPEPVNSDDREFDAFLTRDEKMIVFSSTRPGGYGGADMYVSIIDQDGNWSDPRNLGPAVNSPSNEYAASISTDGKYLFYTSSRNGHEDIFWISAEVLSSHAVDFPPPETIDYGKIFMSHLMKNWDDVHDVIMRYHYDDPWLNGKVVINMNWRQGWLMDADILENTTGDPAIGQDLIAVLKSWQINEITGSWLSALPVKTSIKGSDRPDFGEYGILTGKVTDQNEKPLFSAMVLLQEEKSSEGRSDTLYTNREGIFIQTLISPGTMELMCSKPGYKTISIKNISIERGHHKKQDITLTLTDK